MFPFFINQEKSFTLRELFSYFFSVKLPVLYLFCGILFTYSYFFFPTMSIGHYLRPIIRGKETKSVEFGAKVNNIQIDGISFIEHISFKAFNEGVRLKDCIHLQQQLTRVRVKALAADSIYANNANRKFCTKYHISTSFKRKGRAAKDEPLRKILRSELSRERATRLEGSLGTQKQHYSLARIKARNRKTEVLWIFFGIHTANAVCMIEKVEKKKRTAA